jgi:hypothetical protein
MYRFRIGEMDCACDTIEELQAIAGMATPQPRANKKKARKKRRTSSVRLNTYEIKDLPFIEGGIGWEVVHRVAKKLGKKKVKSPKELRTDLVTRKTMGE